MASEKNVEAQATVLEPPKWHRVGPISLPPFRSTLAQTCLIGFICFLVVGMFNVLGSIGGAGQLDATTADNSNTVLYALFAAIALISGPVCNYLGPKVTLAFGGVGYALYAASFWCFNHTANDGFVMFGGAACGVAAGLFWTAEGTILMSYPLEHQKGRYIAIFWAIWSMGAVIGSIIPTVDNWNQTESGSVKDGTYVALFILMMCGSIFALFLVRPSKVVRDDGSKVFLHTSTSIIQEMKNLPTALRREPYIMLFFPYAFCGLWYIPYQSNDYNSYFFNVRSRGFNSIWYNLATLVGAVVPGLLLDLKRFNRRTRAIGGWVFMFVMLNAILIAGVFPFRESHRGVPYDVMDSLDARSRAYVCLYFFYGFLDGAWQCYAYWIMGCLSNDPLVLSMYAAFYKVFGAAGAAIVFSLDANKKPYVDMFGSYWGLTAGALVCLLPLVLMRVTNHTEKIDDIDYAGAAGELPGAGVGEVVALSEFEKKDPNVLRE
ncbi:MFS general substrate transporter [Schizophyllum commune Tattone D]|nr:MFS general substrate transporter [Schizophyllum commune Tattone D]